MHPNAAFRWEDEAAMQAFVAARGFATLCVSGPEGPIVAHAPLIVTAEGRLRFHLARGNRITRHLDGAHVVASVTDADFYVSPDWYASEDQVPTWNYLAVEIEGPVAALDDAGLAAQVEALSDRFERMLAPKPVWTIDKMAPGRFDAMLKAIRGFELTPTAWRGTRKMGQNKGPDDRAALAQALAAAGRTREAGLVTR
ncbi:FMN-binding negative transcriptional regulator [Sphingomonas sp. PR090111-T3T-6A]|uniref:FMN-binding negative transcriptional regulator n=1 Tax=Sphingomonas sp. PR090111-T3T-6A TaxID=685778 RepID=UPI0003634817|nr:FMN-binding negative transcriptional regulator [Sphingomonas sp. PR090111-T3T-6A]